MKIMFLHTSNSHINRFEKIVKEIDKNIDTEHFVNERILEVALRTGNIDVRGFTDEINRIKKESSGKIICTCSTYGGLCNGNDVLRIDKPIAEKIVSEYSQIGIAFTAKSTKEISKKLLITQAKKQGKQITIKEINCEDSWAWFQKGNLIKYSIDIANRIKQKRSDCEVILLAQASMEGAKEYLVNEAYKTVSSPKYGVEKYIELIKKKHHTTK